MSGFPAAKIVFPLEIVVYFVVLELRCFWLLCSILSPHAGSLDLGLHFLPVNGKITNAVKEEWGLRAVWDEIVRPRYEALNEALNEEAFNKVLNKALEKVVKTGEFGYWESDSESGRKFFRFPKLNENGAIRKRIDHRHHALDAIAIACTTRAMVQYFNNENACSGGASYQRLKRSLFEDTERRGRDGKPKKRLRKPWPTFTQDSKAAIRAIIPSFKNEQRVLERTSNSYFKYVEEVDTKGNKVWRKKRERQARGGKHWSVRKELFQQTIYGERNPDGMASVAVKGKMYPERTDLVRRYTFERRNGFILSASRKSLVDYLGAKGNFEGVSLAKIDKIADFETQEILLRYFERYQGNLEKKTFMQNDLNQLNDNIFELNGNRWHAPIKKITEIESATLTSMSESGEKQKKRVKTAKGGNICVGVYQSNEGKRDFLVKSIREAISARIEGGDILPSSLSGKKDDYRLLFTLHANDLVYFPTEEELSRPIQEEDIYRSLKDGRNSLYRMKSADRSKIYFRLTTIAEELWPNSSSSVNELGFSAQKAEDSERQTLKGQDGDKGKDLYIKNVCVKVNLDRLGRIKSIEQ